MDDTAPIEVVKDLPTELPKELPSGEEHHSSNQYTPKTLLSWNAPGRPYRKRGKQFFGTSLLLALLVEVLLFLFAQYILMLVVASLVFMYFSFVLVPPKEFNYKITTEGLMVEDHFYLWQELYDFYFKNREGVDILMVRTHSFFPGELSISLGSVEKSHVISVMAPFLPYREYIKPTFMDKSADWLVRTFPLESK